MKTSLLLMALSTLLSHAAFASSQSLTWAGPIQADKIKQEFILNQPKAGDLVLAYTQDSMDGFCNLVADAVRTSSGMVGEKPSYKGKALAKAGAKAPSASLNLAEGRADKVSSLQVVAQLQCVPSTPVAPQ